MKKTLNHLLTFPYLDKFDNLSMNSLKGGTADSNEGWELIYIDGKPIWVKKDSNGQIIEILAA